MKQVKIAYDECRKKMPNRPPDEIDFGLGFRAGLGEMLNRLNGIYNGGLENSDIVKWIKEELQ